MKTNFLNFYKQQTTTQCESTLQKFYSLPFLFRQLASLLVKIRQKTLNLTAALLTFLGGLNVYQVIQLISVSVKEAWTNKRFRFGVFIGMVALPAWKCHLFFDINTRIPDFYYVNYVFYFNTIRGYLAFFFLLTGAFIAMPQKWAFRWLAIPFAVFCATEIYAESFYTDWTDFYNPMPNWQMWTFIAFCIPALYKSIDYLAYRKYHLKDGNVARIIGMIKVPGLTAEQKMNELEKLVKESENFNARI